MQWLKGKNLWPVPDPATVPENIDEVIKQAKSCRVSGPNGCNPFPDMEASLENITDLQTPQELVAHLHSQAKKSGLKT